MCENWMNVWKMTKMLAWTFQNLQWRIWCKTSSDWQKHGALQFAEVLALGQQHGSFWKPLWRCSVFQVRWFFPWNLLQRKNEHEMHPARVQPCRCIPNSARMQHSYLLPMLKSKHPLTSFSGLRKIFGPCQCATNARWRRTCSRVLPEYRNFVRVFTRNRELKMWT